LAATVRKKWKIERENPSERVSEKFTVWRGMLLDYGAEKGTNHGKHGRYGKVHHRFAKI
jgi:hypothetical protein